MRIGSGFLAHLAMLALIPESIVTAQSELAGVAHQTADHP